METKPTSYEEAIQALSSASYSVFNTAHRKMRRMYRNGRLDYRTMDSDFQGLQRYTNMQLVWELIDIDADASKSIFDVNRGLVGDLAWPTLPDAVFVPGQSK
jgi:UDP-N-acetylmuramyl tripeptide synthase